MVVENYRPGTFERWGIGQDVLEEVNPKMVMLRISGFGQTGPYASRAGFGRVAEAMAGRRDALFLVRTVYPHNAGHRDAVAACERSLKRLKTDRIDLYLLHWPGSVPLEETFAAFQELREAAPTS